MTEMHDPPESIGDCWRACVATILQRPIEQVPHFEKDALEHPPSTPDGNGTWRTSLWLGKQGYSLIRFSKDAPTWTDDNVLYMASGPSPRNPETGHTVVYDGVKVVHDPHPSRDGLHKGQITAVWLITVAPRRRTESPS